jgi:hypothetical protein
MLGLNVARVVDHELISPRKTGLSEAGYINPSRDLAESELGESVDSPGSSALGATSFSDTPRDGST